MLAQATKTGPAVAAFCEMVMADRPHREQSFRTCLGCAGLGQNLRAGARRCRLPAGRHHPRAPMFSTMVTSIRSILKTGLDRAFLEGSEKVTPLQHANIRGGGYYHFERTRMLTHPTHDRLLAAVPIGGLTGIASALEEQRRSPAFDVLSLKSVSVC